MFYKNYWWEARELIIIQRQEDPKTLHPSCLASLDAARSSRADLVSSAFTCPCAKPRLCPAIVSAFHECLHLLPPSEEQDL